MDKREEVRTGLKPANAAIMILFIVATSFNFIGVSAQASPATLFFVDPPAIIDPTKTPGTSITVQVKVTDADYLYSWQVYMSWNASILSTAASKISFGGFLTDQPEGSSTSTRVETNFLIIGETTMGKYLGKDGDGLLASITFTVKATGQTTLNIDTNFTYYYKSEVVPVLEKVYPTRQNGYFSNLGPAPTQLKFSLDPNPAIVGQTITLLGNLTIIGSIPIGGAMVTIKVNGAPVGTLTTNSTGWFKAGAPAPSVGTYTVRVEYAGSAQYLPSYDEHVLIVKTGLSIAIYTDKYTYHTGETMHVGLDVSNVGSAVAVRFVIWITLPSGGYYIYKDIPSVTIPAGLAYSDPNFATITLPSIPPGKYTWHAALLKPATTTIIVQDAAEWEFV